MMTADNIKPEAWFDRMRRWHTGLYVAAWAILLGAAGPASALDPFGVWFWSFASAVVALMTAGTFVHGRIMRERGRNIAKIKAGTRAIMDAHIAKLIAFVHAPEVEIKPLEGGGWILRCRGEAVTVRAEGDGRAFYYSITEGILALRLKLEERRERWNAEANGIELAEREPWMPYVCPGCYAVCCEPCAPGCWEQERERKREEERELARDTDPVEADGDPDDDDLPF